MSAANSIIPNKVFSLEVVEHEGMLHVNISSPFPFTGTQCYGNIVDSIKSLCGSEIHSYTIPVWLDSEIQIETRQGVTINIAPTTK